MTTTPPLDLVWLNAVTDAAISGSSEFFKDNSSLTKMHNCLSKNELFSAEFNPQTGRLLLDRLQRAEQFVHEASQSAGKMINGNRLSIKAQNILEKTK
ncbi:MAG: hypothetical protein V4447_10505 [Pseudomonadota bacterium]